MRMMKTTKDLVRRGEKRAQARREMKHLIERSLSLAVLAKIQVGGAEVAVRHLPLRKMTNKKKNSDNEGRNGYGRDIDKKWLASAWDQLNEVRTKFFEQRLRQAEMRSAPITRELNAKLGLEPFYVSDNESGDKNDGGAQKERAENQCKKS